MKVKKDLSDVQHYPPRRADRGQTLDWAEIIASLGPKPGKLHMASLLGSVDRLISQVGVCGYFG